MKDQFEQIRDQIHEIHNSIADIRLERLDHQVKNSRAVFDLKTAELEAQVALHTAEIASHAEQLRQIRIFLKILPTAENRPPAPVREDKQQMIEIPSVKLAE